MKKITQEDVRGFFKNGKRIICNTSLKIADIVLSEERTKGFSEGIEIGIKNTIDALYDTNISDTEIIQIVNKHWGIETIEIEERLVWEKSQLAINALKHYLRLNGYSSQRITEFMQKTKAGTIIRNNNELWKLKDKPEELYKRINGGEI